MTEITLSRSALALNLDLVRSRVAPAEVMAVVKDDAYGHGMREVVPFLHDQGVSRFGVLDLDGASRVRVITPDASVFAWVVDDGDDIGAAVADGIELGVSDRRVLERVATSGGAGQVARVHIKVDSGLHRAGVLPEDWPDFVKRVAELEAKGSIEVAGVWTHIAEASDEADSAAIGVFETAVATARAAGLRPPVRHLAASAAAFSRADARFDLVRVGAFLYGIAPGSGVGPAELGLHPVLTASAPVVDVDPVSGLVRIDCGAVDGMLADAAGAVSVTIRRQRHPLVSVSSFASTVAIDGSEPLPQVGDSATLFGSGAAGEQTVTEWADAMATIGEELVTRFGRRASRVWV